MAQVGCDGATSGCPLFGRGPPLNHAVGTPSRFSHALPTSPPLASHRVNGACHGPLGSVSQSAPGVRSGRLHGFQREVPRVLIEPCPNALCQRI
jgi:hypothetical protein